jgi:hypothetical protein
VCLTQKQKNTRIFFLRHEKRERLAECAVLYRISGDEDSDRRCAV